MSKLIIRNCNLPEDHFVQLRPNVDFVPMSERIRAFVDESQALDTTNDFSFDTADAVSVDPNVDFHIGFMEAAEAALHAAGDSPANSRQKVDDKSNDLPSATDKPTK